MRRALLDWLDSRTSYRTLLHHVLDEPLPKGTGWFFTTGSVLLLLLGVQLATGVVLTMYYVPAPALAYDSVRYIMERVTFGRVLRGLHFFGASFIVIAAVIHMIRVVLARKRCKRGGRQHSAMWQTRKVLPSTAWRYRMPLPPPCPNPLYRLRTSAAGYGGTISIVIRVYGRGCVRLSSASSTATRCKVGKRCSSNFLALPAYHLTWQAQRNRLLTY